MNDFIEKDFGKKDPENSKRGCYKNKQTEITSIRYIMYVMYVISVKVKVRVEIQQIKKIMVE